MKNRLGVNLDSSFRGEGINLAETGCQSNIFFNAIIFFLNYAPVSFDNKTIFHTAIANYFLTYRVSRPKKRATHPIHQQRKKGHLSYTIKKSHR